MNAQLANSPPAGHKHITDVIRKTMPLFPEVHILSYKAVTVSYYLTMGSQAAERITVAAQQNLGWKTVLNESSLKNRKVLFRKGGRTTTEMQF